MRLIYSCYLEKKLIIVFYGWSMDCLNFNSKSISIYLFFSDSANTSYRYQLEKGLRVSKR